MKYDYILQHVYGRSPLYCYMDDSVIAATDYGFWFHLDGDLSAPEFLPTGGADCRYVNGGAFIQRGITLEEDEILNALTDLLIDEIIAESKD